MGTTYSVKIVKNDSVFSLPFYDNLKKQVDSILFVVNKQMSTYIKDSEISRFNAFDDTNWFPVSKDFVRVVKTALEVSVLSNSALDITIGPVVNLWGFGPEKNNFYIPEDQEINVLLTLTGIDKIAIIEKPPAIKKAIPEMYIDLSSIAKGFGVDKIAEYCNSLDINNYMVEIGGEVRTAGLNQNRSLWNIGIIDPKDKSSVGRILRLQNESLATSGDYYNYFEKNGKLYSHTIDPRTGKPVGHMLSSVSVLHKSCMYADAYATAINVMGPLKGLRFANKLKLPALLIVKKDNEYEYIPTLEFNEILERK